MSGSVTASATKIGYLTLDDGITYPVFSSSGDGVGWILKAGAGPDTVQSLGLVAQSPDETLLYTYPGGNAHLATKMAFVWVRYPSTAPLASGTYTVPAYSNVFTPSCVTDAGSKVSGIPFDLNSSPSITIKAVTCNVNTSNHTVTMPDVDWLALSKITNAFYDKSVYGETKINMTCDSGVVPKFNVQARTEGGSGSTGIGLESSSIASGFTLVLAPEKPDFSGTNIFTVQPGNTTQYNFIPGHIFDGVNYTTPVSAGDIEIPFYVGIYRTSAELKAGTYTALVTFNFTYQ